LKARNHKRRRWLYKWQPPGQIKDIVPRPDAEQLDPITARYYAVAAYLLLALVALFKPDLAQRTAYKSLRKKYEPAGKKRLWELFTRN